MIVLNKILRTIGTLIVIFLQRKRITLLKKFDFISKKIDQQIKLFLIFLLAS